MRKGWKKNMNEKMKKVSEALQGMSYLEWTKLRHVIDVYFDNEASDHKKKS